MPSTRESDTSSLTRNVDYQLVQNKDLDEEHLAKADITQDVQLESTAAKDNQTKRKGQEKVIGMFKMFKFSDKKDRALIVFGIIFSSINGFLVPANIVIFTKMLNEFINYSVQSEGHAINITQQAEALKQNLSILTPIYIGIGLLVWIVSYAQLVCWGISAERQTRRIQLKLFKKILSMHIGWFDTHNVGQLSNCLTEDICKIKEGIGDKAGRIVYYLSQATTCIVVAMVFNWKLTLVLLSLSPLNVLATFIILRYVSLLSVSEFRAYSKAGAVAEEVFGAIRTVISFGGQVVEIDRYTSKLDEAMKYGIRKNVFNGIGIGLMWAVMFGSYALGFWYGSQLVRDKNEDVDEGTVLLVLLCIYYGSFSFGTAAPYMQSVAESRGAACSVFTLLDLKSNIDGFSKSGLKPKIETGDVEFQDVSFYYPSRGNFQVLEKLQIKINAGERVAIVGPSGVGKSTVFQLIQRFYDPTSGRIRFSGVDIKVLNVGWLREKIGIVSQEPVLFDTTIAENMRLGRLEVTLEEMKSAAMTANAHDFIMDLPDKYDTVVGENGVQLSGGQKQRIAIARALIRNPVLLLLDEATSSLDSESEAIVQEALDKASMGRTTLIIAHRLSTVRGADRIIVINEGRVVEEGTHTELIEKSGLYSQLVKTQMVTKKVKDVYLNDDQHRIHGKHVTYSSIESIPDETKMLETKESVADKFSTMRVIRLNKPEYLLLALGILFALIAGATQPAFAVVFAKALFKFRHWKTITFYGIGCIGLALLILISFVIQGYMNGISGERLTKRLRHMSFKTMIYQDMTWFDEPENNTGSLCTQLAVDASQVRGATGVRLGTIVQQIGTIVGSILLSFAHEWAMTLVISAFFPFLALASYLQFYIMAGTTLLSTHQLQEVGKVSTQCIENIRTIASLCRENWFYQDYLSKFEGLHSKALRRVHVIGAAFGFSEGIPFFIMTAGLNFGAWRISQGAASGEDVLIVFSLITFATMSAGNASFFAPDYGKAKASAINILKLLDKVSKINTASSEGVIPSQADYRSSIKFSNVEFKYPTRDVKVLCGLKLKVNPNDTVALVGSSGCGKSTIISLIERFYDINHGSLKFSGLEVSSLNVKWLRSQIGIVSQEPILFDRTIRENIAYGDNSRDVPFDEIVDAARKANIHSFISSLPMKYETNVGTKGVQLSGGQKQRVAIARALVRNPKILLLDEATSALDSESEKVVQEALDKAREGRTCIVIAHRLNTILNVDKIYVIKDGLVAEQGTHAELMADKKFYYKLQTNQLS